MVFRSVRYRCVYAGLYAVSLLPVTLLYQVANLAFFLIYYIIRYRREVVHLNMARSFPKQRYEEISIIKKKFYRGFMRHFADIVKAISISPKIMDEKIEFIGLEILDEAINSGKSVIASLGHCSNWEMLHFLSHKISHEVYAVYKPLSSDVMNRLMIKLRTRFGMKVITDRSVIRHIRSNNSPPAVYLFLADQCPQVNDENFRYCFLNQDTYFFSGMEKLARKSNSVVVYLNIKQLPDRRYKVTCKPVSNRTDIESEGEITRKYAELLEENIKEQPGSWLWTHKRWKR
ncbi:lysophospholipid acyltransferase family protein [Niabella yanshanensis]|uniref:Lysophospholipid acyltransferase family protein n=1 Tax=Niabella yanshanensis TaxID=577386 RepID=A0ABZ0W969_9BACT|nr:lysophospholipid acyltransferase family protein [Niabella yanshanensis]WQD39676.1 lysophospholipid acyltransferase family protein [Niabella yanshanensis]